MHPLIVIRLAGIVAKPQPDLERKLLCMVRDLRKILAGGPREIG